MIDSFYHRRVFFSLSVFTGPVQMTSVVYAFYAVRKSRLKTKLFFIVILNHSFNLCAEVRVKGFNILYCSVFCS